MMRELIGMLMTPPAAARSRASASSRTLKRNASGHSSAKAVLAGSTESGRAWIKAIRGADMRPLKHKFQRRTRPPRRSWPLAPAGLPVLARGRPLLSRALLARRQQDERNRHPRKLGRHRARYRE